MGPSSRPCSPKATRSGCQRGKTGVQRKGEKLCGAIPMSSRGTLNAMDQELELFGSQRTTAAFSLDPRERASLEPFGVKHQARPVPAQHLESVPGSVDEDEQETGRGVLVQALFDQRIETIEPLASVDRSQRQEHPG